MTQQLRKLMLMLVAILALPTFFIACGGGSKTVTTVTAAANSAAQQFFRAANVLRPNRSGNSTAQIHTNPFLAEAQTTSPTVPTSTGNFSGFCGTTAPASQVAVFGLGRWTDANCGSNIVGFNVGDGAPVQGQKALGNLVVYAEGVGGSATSGTLTVFVNSTATSITCNIGLGSNDGKANKCTDTTHAVSVVDGDLVQVILKTQAGDNYSNVRVLLGAQ